MRLLRAVLGLALVLGEAGSLRAEEGAAQSTSSVETESPPRERWVELHPQISILNFNTLDLAKNGEVFTYADSIKGVPMLSLNLSSPVGAWGPFDLYGIFRFGYGTKAGEVALTNGTSQWVRIHSIPLELLVKARYQIPAVPSIRPAFLIGAGNQFFHQSARDDRYTASYFIPNLITGINVGLFDPGKTSTDWFGGFNFGVCYHHGLFSENRLRAISFDLGIVVVL